MHEPDHIAPALDEQRLGSERLARRLALLGDEDAVQDTFVAAMGSDRPRGLGWFTTVARHFVRRRRREAVARRWRESRAARSETTAAADEAVQRAEVAQRVLTAVLALDQPYRSVTLLRYFDDLTPAEIARRIGRPPATVRKQLERAHSQLRARLAPAGADEDAWLRSLAPLLAGAKRTRALASPSAASAAIALASLATIVTYAAWRAIERDEREAASGALVVAEAAEVPVAAAPQAGALVADASDPARARLAPAAPEGTRAARLEADTVPHAPRAVDDRTEALTIRGRVQSERGAAVADAAVDFGYATARSDQDGRFELRVLPHELADDPPLTAWRRGSGAAVRPALAATLRAEGRAEGIVLALPDHAEVARGRVVDEHGRGLAGWSVALADGTRHGSFGTPLEYAVAGIEGLAVATDERGEFELGGLLPREYRLRAIDDASDVVLEGRVGPGAWDVTLLRAADALVARVGGRVVDAHGAPIAGAGVALERAVIDVGFSAVLESTHMTRTDAVGRFELADVPRARVVLVVGGDEAVRTERPIEEHLAHPDVDVVAERRYRFIVEPRPGERATHARVLDGEGTELTLDFRLPDLEAHRPLLPLTGPGTPAVAHVRGSARTLVLERDGSELRRMPLVLEPLTVNRVAP